MRSLPRTDASVQPTRAPPLRAVRALNRAYRSSDLSKGVVGAPSPSGVFHQDALSDEVLDIAQRRVLRALGEFRHFEVVSFPSKPSRRRLSTSRWRAFSGKSEIDSQKSPTVSTGPRKALFPRQHGHFSWVSSGLGTRPTYPLSSISSPFSLTVTCRTGFKGTDRL